VANSSQYSSLRGGSVDIDCNYEIIEDGDDEDEKENKCKKKRKSSFTSFVSYIILIIIYRYCQRNKESF
jgi:hypothetical protein